MSRKPARFTEAEIRRAWSAVAKSGVPGVVYVALDGTIRIGPVSDESETKATDATPPKKVIVL
jgi:hypothetical protein